MIRYLLIFLRRSFLSLRHHRHFSADYAHHPLHHPCRRLLGKSFAPFPPLAAPTPLFRPYGAKLGKQRCRPAQSQNLRHQHDESVLHLHVLALPRTMVDRRSIHIGLRLRRRLDVAASRTLSRASNTRSSENAASVPKPYFQTTFCHFKASVLKYRQHKPSKGKPSWHNSSPSTPTTRRNA